MIRAFHTLPSTVATSLIFALCGAASATTPAAKANSPVSAAPSVAVGLAPAPRPGFPAPDFTLPDPAGTKHSLSQYKGKWVVLEWVNYDCPFVKKHYGSGSMQKTQKAARDQGVVWLSINSSAPGKQGNFAGQELVKRIADLKAGPDAYLLDPEGKVGMEYKAKTTPTMFVINPAGMVTYTGAIDDKPSTDQGDIPGAKNYVQAALDAGMAGKPVEM
ncbi:MAG: redoxin domain-containing protein, partial [Fibrobacteria bacterium]